MTKNDLYFKLFSYGSPFWRVKNMYYSVRNGLRAWFVWAKVLWRYTNRDYVGLLEVWIKSLELMAVGLSVDYMDRTNEISNINRCVELLKHARDNDGSIEEFKSCMSEFGIIIMNDMPGWWV